MKQNQHTNSSPTPSAPILVTGASGFIAMHIIKQLLEAGLRVRGTLRTLSRGAAVREALERQLGPVGDRLEFVAADLLSDDGWDDAVRGCDYVLHVASPIPRKPPKHEDELIVPARDGAVRVLAAAAGAGIKRVVMTSSVAAILYGHDRTGDRVFNESDWSDLDGPVPVGAYEKSKTIAERAAWAYLESLPAESRPEFATINPGLVLGPVLDSDYGTSGEVVRKLMKRELPGIPDLGWAVVDVRDVASAHIAALFAPDAPGKRFACAVDHASMASIAEILRAQFEGRGYRIPHRKVPSWLLRFASLFDSTTRLAVNDLGQSQHVDSRRIREVLGWNPRPLDEMVVDMGESLIEHGVV